MWVWLRPGEAIGVGMVETVYVGSNMCRDG